MKASMLAQLSSFCIRSSRVGGRHRRIWPSWHAKQYCLLSHVGLVLASGNGAQQSPHYLKQAEEQRLSIDCCL